MAGLVTSDRMANNWFVLGFSMRAIARLFGLGCVWPALGNLTRRKLRGLVEPYGESVKQVLPQL